MAKAQSYKVRNNTPGVGGVSSPGNLAKSVGHVGDYPAPASGGTGGANGKDFPGHAFDTASAATALQDRNLMDANPTSDQFEPTDAAPVRQKHRMAGAG